VRRHKSSAAPSEAGSLSSSSRPGEFTARCDQMRHAYSVLSEVECEPCKRTVTNLAVELSARKLGIAKPSFFFIVEDPSGPIVKEGRIAGASGPTGKMFILHDQSLDEIVKTVAHEARHLRWYADGMKGSIEQAERNARIFELEFWGLRDHRASAWEELTKIKKEMDGDQAEIVYKFLRNFRVVHAACSYRSQVQLCGVLYASLCTDFL
jgi:hypothetical protein